MKVNVTCVRTVYHTQSGALYQMGKNYSVVPTPELAECFGFEPSLRATLRMERARQLGKAPSDVKKMEEQDAKKLADIAHENMPKYEPRTLHELTQKPINLNPDGPTALSQLGITTPFSD